MPSDPRLRLPLEFRAENVDQRLNHADDDQQCSCSFYREGCVSGEALEKLLHALLNGDLAEIEQCNESLDGTYPYQLVVECAPPGDIANSNLQHRDTSRPLRLFVGCECQAFA